MFHVQVLTMSVSTNSEGILRGNFCIMRRFDNNFSLHWIFPKHFHLFPTQPFLSSIFIRERAYFMFMQFKGKYLQLLNENFSFRKIQFSVLFVKQLKDSLDNTPRITESSSCNCEHESCLVLVLCRGKLCIIF